MPSRMAETAADMPQSYQIFNNDAQEPLNKTARHRLTADLLPEIWVREWAFHGWCALADVGKYLRRGSVWEALIQLNEARDQLWRLHAVAGGVPDPQFGLTSILDFSPETIMPGMAATVADLDPARLVSAARHLANLLSQAGQQLPVEHRAALPDAMTRYVISDLQQMTTIEEDSR